MNDSDNDLIATGGLFGALLASGHDPVVVMKGGLVTNTLTIKPPFMESRYQFTVERVPGTEGTPSSLWRWAEPGEREADHVLWQLGDLREGVEPSGFITELIRLMCRADHVMLGRLALGFPGYASAVWAAKNDGDGLGRLREIAGRVRT